MSRIEYNPSLNDKVAGQLGDLNVEIQIPLSSIKTLFDETPPASYKVYTALVTQSGGNDVQYINWDDDPNTLTIGVTYSITENDDNTNFIPNGAPNNNVGTSFIATSSIVNWGTANTGGNQLSYNAGAPTVTVLENTIGNIWFTYSDVGIYNINSDGLFTDNKTFVNISQTVQNSGDSSSQNLQFVSPESTTNQLVIQTVGAEQDGIGKNTPIEIRVYN